MRRSESVLRRSQLARREPPLVLLNLRPWPMPRCLRPAEVLPRSSRCLCTALQIQLTLASCRIACSGGRGRQVSGMEQAGVTVGQWFR